MEGREDQEAGKGKTLAETQIPHRDLQAGSSQVSQWAGESSCVTVLLWWEMKSANMVTEDWSCVEMSWMETSNYPPWVLTDPNNHPQLPLGVEWLWALEGDDPRDFWLTGWGFSHNLGTLTMIF